jgi:hypothetical protein
MKDVNKISVDFKNLKCTVTFDKGALIKDVVKVANDFDRVVKQSIAVYLKNNNIENNQENVEKLLEALTVDDVLDVVVQCQDTVVSIN